MQILRLLPNHALVMPIDIALTDNSLGTLSEIRLSKYGNKAPKPKPALAMEIHNAGKDTDFAIPNSPNDTNMKILGRNIFPDFLSKRSIIPAASIASEFRANK